MAYWKKGRPIYVLILIFLVLQIVLMVNRQVWWDESVFIGMGKHLFSSGAVGLWEAERPLLLPAYAGVKWAMGADPLLAGRVLSLALSALSIYLVYLIGRKVFGKKEALLAAVMFSALPAFFQLAGLFLTDTVSVFFVLWAFYLFITRKSSRYAFLCGVLLGIAFLARYPAAFAGLSIVLSVIIFELVRTKRAKNAALAAKNTALIIAGFFVASAPYFLFNFVAYGDALHGIKAHSSFLSGNYLWIYDKWAGFYFAETLYQGFFLVFSLAGIFYIARERGWKKQDSIAIVLLPAILFAFFSAVVHKESRYILSFAPFLALLASYGFLKVYSKGKAARTNLSYLLAAVLVASLLFSAYQNYEALRYAGADQEFHRNIMLTEFSGTVFTTTPVVAVYTDSRVVQLYASPEYAVSRFEEIINTPGFVVFSTCDIPCSPSDSACMQSVRTFSENVKGAGTVLYHNKTERCEYFIERI